MIGLMGSFNGKDYVLEFGCGDCGITGNHYRASIIIDPERDEDMKHLQRWLLTHSADGGEYRTIYRRHNAEAIQRFLENGWKPVGDINQKGLKLRLDGIEIDADTIQFVPVKT